MQAAPISLLKKTLREYDKPELIELCLRLAKFKKDSKELLSYLLFDDHDKESYIATVKLEIEDEFEEINTSSYYYIKKSARKVLRNIKKYIRFTQSKEVEVELLMYWCICLKEITPSYVGNIALTNLYDRQVILIRKALSTLNEDLQFDYEQQINELIQHSS